MKTIDYKKYDSAAKIAREYSELLSPGALVQFKIQFDFLSDLFFKIESKKTIDFIKNKKYNILTVETVNHGSKKWSNWIKHYEIKTGLFIKESECYYFFDKFKIKKDNVKYILL